MTSTAPADGRDRDTKKDDAWLGFTNNDTTKDEPRRVNVICSSDASIESRSKAKFVPHGDTHWRVKCPAGTHVAGGGVDASRHEQNVFVRSSKPVDGADAGDAPDDGWLGEVTNNRDEPVKAVVWAICTKQHYAYLSKLIEFFPDDKMEGSVTCPNSDGVTGGGAAGDFDSNFRVLASSAPIQAEDADSQPDDAWFSRIESYSGLGQDITFYAICQK
jgi:hypothetical protein